MTSVFNFFILCPIALTLTETEFLYRIHYNIDSKNFITALKATQTLTENMYSSKNGS